MEIDYFPMLILSKYFGQTIKIRNRKTNEELIILVRKSKKSDRVEIVFDDPNFNFLIDKVIYAPNTYGDSVE
jgi:hypothetical protein